MNAQPLFKTYGFYKNEDNDTSTITDNQDDHIVVNRFSDQINQAGFDRLAASSFRELKRYGYTVIHTKETTTLRRPDSEHYVSLENSARTLASLSEVAEQCSYLQQIKDYAEVAREVGIIPDYYVYPMPGQDGSAHFYNDRNSKTITINLDSKSVLGFRYLCADYFYKNAFLTEVKPKAEAKLGIEFFLSDSYFQYRRNRDDEWSSMFTYYANDIKIFLDELKATYTVPNYIVCRPPDSDGLRLIECEYYDDDTNDTDDDADYMESDALPDDLSDDEQLPQAQ